MDAPAPADPGSKQEPYQGDLHKTQILQELFGVPREARDGTWKESLLSNVAAASFACGDPQIIRGPDGFPYFQLFIPEPDKPFTCFVIQHMMNDFLLKDGLGVVLSTLQSKNPEWVFTSGDILNYRLNGMFYSPPGDWYAPAPGQPQEKEEILAGQPSEEILTAEARALIRRFMEANDIHDNKVLLMMRKQESGIAREIVFNMTPDKCKSQEHFDFMMNHVSWYLPRHYSFSAMKESGWENNFEPL